MVHIAVHPHYLHYYLHRICILGLVREKFQKQSIPAIKPLAQSQNDKPTVHYQFGKDIKGKILNLIETLIFDLSINDAYCLKDKLVHPEIRHIFNLNGVTLSSDAQIEAIDRNKWTLRDSGKNYNIRRLDESFSVFIQHGGVIASFIRVLGIIYYFIKDDFNRLNLFLSDNFLYLKYSYTKKFIDNHDFLMVNIGSGKWYNKNWRVLDYSANWYSYPKYFIDYEYDLMSLKKLPFPDDSVNLFYSEHVLEHLPDDICIHIFKEIHRSLISGGGFRIVVPDADLIYEMLVNENKEFFEPWIMRENATVLEAFFILVAHPRVPFEDMEVKNNLLKMEKEEFLNYYSGKLKYDYKKAGEHINWFNYEKLKIMLENAGFHIVKKTNAQESIFQEIRGDCFDTRARYSLHVDAIK